MSNYYSLDTAIVAFFRSKTNVSREQCDQYARAHLGGEPQPVPLQGVSSYTVTSDASKSKLLQFRDELSPLDGPIMRMAKSIHPDVVAPAQHLDFLGAANGLHVYEMERLPGETYVTAADHSIIQPSDAKARQRNTVLDLAVFFAQSWNNPLKIADSVQEEGQKQVILAEFSYKLGRLVESLPSRFCGKLHTLFTQLPALVSSIPLVLTHEDLCEMNILVNKESGHITGVIDWAEARHLPFGISLWALENVLGFMNNDGWHYYDNWEELEALFWETFVHETKGLEDCDSSMIPVARVIGIFLRYGFVMEETIERVAKETDMSRFAYLDAFCLDEES